MTINTKLLKLLAGAAFVTASISTTAIAETKLALSSWLSPRHPIVVDAI